MEAFRQFFSTNWELILFALGGIGAIAGVVIAGIWAFLKWQRRRNLPIDTFPFKIIEPHSRKVLQQLMGGTAETDRLADFNIPYQHRATGRDIRQELVQMLRRKGAVLILGKSGIGKTREAATVAETLNQDGWTILKLKAGEWLDAYPKIPTDQFGENAKLLFFLDDLNHRMHSSRKERSPRAEDPMQPLNVPLQERLLRMLESYERVFRRDQQILVIATARNESVPLEAGKPSELDKLELNKYPNLWNRFERYELPEPENEAIEHLLADTAPKAKVKVRPEDFSRIAQRNDRTFRNIIENLRTAKRDNLLLAPDTFSRTLDQTWERRYERAIELRPTARYIYDAIELLQAVNVELHGFTVASTAELIACHHSWQKPWWRWIKIRPALRWLIAAEDILKPQDGQIEAKGRSIAVEKYIPRLSKLLIKLADRHSPAMLASLFGFAFATSNLNFYQQSLESIEKFLRFFNTLGEAWFIRGFALGNLGRYTQAINSYSQASQYKLDYHEAWNNKGNLLNRLGQYNEALECFDQALQYKSDSGEAWYNKGVALGGLERYNEAIDSYEHALKHKPNLHEAWNNKGNVLDDLGHHDEAIDCYNQSLRHCPDYHTASYNKGIALRNLGHDDEAIQCFDQVLRYESENYTAWYHKGISLGILGRHDEAIQCFDQTLHYEPNSHTALYNKGIALRDLGRYDEAIECFDQALRHEPDDYEAWGNKGISLYMVSRYNEAIVSFDEAIKCKPDYYEAWNNRGFTLAELGFVEEAIASFERFPESFPDSVAAYCYKACCYGLQGRIEETIETLQRAIALDSEVRKLARTNADFDAIRGDDRFQALIEGRD